MLIVFKTVLSMYEINDRHNTAVRRQNALSLSSKIVPKSDFLVMYMYDL